MTRDKEDSDKKMKCVQFFFWNAWKCKNYFNYFVCSPCMFSLRCVIFLRTAEYVRGRR